MWTLQVSTLDHPLAEGSVLRSEVGVWHLRCTYSILEYLCSFPALAVDSSLLPAPALGTSADGSIDWVPAT